MPGNPTQLAEELAREREEVRRLRGLLVARDAELGAARGRLLQIETWARHLLEPAVWLRAVPRKLAARLRGARS